MPIKETKPCEGCGKTYPKDALSRRGLCSDCAYDRVVANAEIVRKLRHNREAH